MEFFSPIVIFEYRMDPNNDSFDSEVCFFMQNLLFRNSFKSSGMCSRQLQATGSVH